MPNIHISSSPYTAPAPTSGWSWQPFPALHLSTINTAISVISSRIQPHTSCNAAFSALPGRRSFTSIWSDPNIWISYDPGNKPGRYGATLNKRHVTISAFALNMGRWTTAATLIHELAHVAGAGGSDTSAEDVLLDCLLKDLHDPKIIGQANDIKYYPRIWLA